MECLIMKMNPFSKVHQISLLIYTCAAHAKLIVLQSHTSMLNLTPLIPASELYLSWPWWQIERFCSYQVNQYILSYCLFSSPPLSQHSWLHFWKAHHNLLVPHVCCWSSQLLLGPLFWKRLSNIYKNCNEHHLPTASYSLNLCSKGVGRGERGWGRSTFLANQYPEADVWNEPTKPLLVCHKSNALWDFVVLT